MVSLSSSSSTARYAQLILGVILLGLSGKIINDRSSLTSLADELAEIYNSTSSEASFSLAKRDFSEPSLYIDPSWKKSAVVISSACTSISSNSLNYALPKLFTKKNTNSNTQALLWKSSVFRTLSTSASEFVSKTALGVSLKQAGYASSLFGSEAISQALWITSIIIQVSQYGSQSCSSVEGLISSYNLTSDLSEVILSNYYNEDESNNSTSSDNQLYDEIESLFSQSNSSNLSGSLSSLLDSYNSNNLTTLEKQSALLLQLASNCQLKKSSMALSIITFATYLFSSTFLASSAVSFVNQYRKQKEQAAKAIQTTPERSENEATEVPEPQVHFVYRSDWLLPDILSDEELISVSPV
ncbi:hypothetical protein KL905_002635 [Ogataea polymorpha]|uniref:Uncharacterized protein n=1 Tax=Ogataea polymorpha TaxID=460523 RepID=A0A1B7SP94_9ASCO|nr:uncharacterized protein OGAPODRAFT_5951 [Ogataea polymorpha]KAG7894508.1 hypothetical protein KL908_001880 [Ogataea polymorpha]KAG7899900.1 hypothetical protein KL935_003441 [Ogataea polymorpha]KAG7906739.1 hypothetical protein KL907_002379 [Ogataea polymorpha]KAG7909986.1 hypothetical protein KL906_001891 [Ogataea polymorpha]KAG7917686.1 hypothetical protein KL927_002429 [Ogataea polymorpha]